MAWVIEIGDWFTLLANGPRSLSSHYGAKVGPGSTKGLTPCDPGLPIPLVDVAVGIIGVTAPKDNKLPVNHSWVGSREGPGERRACAPGAAVEVIDVHGAQVVAAERKGVFEQ